MRAALPRHRALVDATLAALTDPAPFGHGTLHCPARLARAVGATDVEALAVLQAIRTAGLGEWVTVVRDPRGTGWVGTYRTLAEVPRVVLRHDGVPFEPDLGQIELLFRSTASDLAAALGGDEAACELDTLLARV